MRVAVLDDYQDAFRSLDAAKKLSAHEVVTFRAAVTPQQLEGFDAIVLTQQRTALPRAFVEQLPSSVRFVAQTGRATSHLDAEALAERGITLVTGGGGDPAAPAELTWALILASRRHLVEEVNALRSEQWQVSVGSSLSGKTLGVYAFGKIGARVAEVGRAFGMRVVCLGREASTARAKAAGFEVADSREAFFAESDVVSLHLPLNAQTRGIVTGGDLGRMKRDALIVNTSRAGIVEGGALESALDLGRPGFAAVDVFEVEPVTTHPLIGRRNVIATPHLGYVTRETYEAYFGGVIEALLREAGG